MLNTPSYGPSKTKLLELLSLLVLADPRHPLAVRHQRTQHVTWVLKSDSWRICPPAFVLVMRGERNNSAHKFVSFPDRQVTAGWMVLTQSDGVSYADSAAIIEYRESSKKVRIRTQRGVAEMVQATKCVQVDPNDPGCQFDVFGLNIKRLLELLVDEGAGQKAPVVLA
ncbi:hypothetical protein BDR26DRAFT_888016 [Obelidium mucronatum]|nr:hypothetical protein BDR26DRAFT_888016 [Obelidium mucronatum]